MEDQYRIIPKDLPEALLPQLRDLGTQLKDGNLFVPPAHLRSLTTLLKESDVPFKVVGSPVALVAMFEFFQGTMGWPEKTSKGLARMTHEGDNLVIDLSVSGLSKGDWTVGLHPYGDFSNGVASAGEIQTRIGTANIGEDGATSGIYKVKGNLWDWIGRSVCMTKNRSDEYLCGILARSAGVFENKKMVCSCSGRTIWEE